MDSYGILIYNIVGYSKLDQYSMYTFHNQVFPHLLSEIESLSKHYETKIENIELRNINSWGDSLIYISKNIIFLTTIAMIIKRYFSKKTWKTKYSENPIYDGLDNLKVRISLHYGLLKTNRNKTYTCNDLYGMNLIIASRIESIVPANCILMSIEYYEELLEKYKFDNIDINTKLYKFEDVGGVKLSEDYGFHHFYELGDDKSTMVFNKLKKMLDLELKSFPNVKSTNNTKNYVDTSISYFNKCFIVHGHNDLMKLEIKNYLVESYERMKCIILHEMPDKGRMVLEKFEDYSDVDFAVCIWSADDVGKSKKETELFDRARENVLFETGFFMGKIGRERVIIIHEDSVKMPSDLHGLIYKPYGINWKYELQKEIDQIYKSE